MIEPECTELIHISVVAAERATSTPRDVILVEDDDGDDLRSTAQLTLGSAGPAVAIFIQWWCHCYLSH